MEIHKLNIGIIGLGRIGTVHYKNILRMPDIQVKVICDLLVDESWKWKYPQAEMFTKDYHELLADPELDAVLICTPTDLHPKMIIDAANAKKNIFCEKPVGFNNEDILKAFETVKRQNVLFEVGFNRRFDKSFKRIVDCRNEGKIGQPQILKITSRDPEPPSYDYVKHSGGLFMDMTIHDFDMARYITGQEAKRVFVSGAVLVDSHIRKYGDIDTAIITLCFDNNMLGVIDNSRKAVYGYDQRIELFGSAGASLVGNVHESEMSYASEKGIVHDDPTYFFLQRYNEAYFSELQSFFGAVRGEHAIQCTFEDGIRAIRLAEAAKESLESNKMVDVKDIYD